MKTSLDLTWFEKILVGALFIGPRVLNNSRLFKIFLYDYYIKMLQNIAIIKEEVILMAKAFYCMSQGFVEHNMCIFMTLSPFRMTSPTSRD